MNNIAITSDYPAFSQSKNAHTTRLDNNERLSISREIRCHACSKRWVIGSGFIFLFLIVFTGSLWLTFSSTTNQNIQMHRIYSRLFTVNSFFVSRILVTNASPNKGLIVYSFSKTPELSKEIGQVEKFNVVISGNDYKAWNFWMNEDSRVEIKYNISDPEMDLLLFVIQGEQNMQDWIRDPTSTNLVSAWRIARDADVFQYKSESNEDHYFTFVNTHSSAVQANVDFQFHIKVHNTAGSKSQCFVTDIPCSIHLNFFTSDVLLLTSLQTQHELEGFGYGRKKYRDARVIQQIDSLWTINITFEQRLVAYLVLWGATLVILLVLFLICSCVSPSSYEQTTTIDRVRLDTLYVEEKAKLQNVDEASSDLEDYMCLICFETRRNCFFEPCGHSAACLPCSVR